MEYSKEDNRDAKKYSDSEENHSDSSTHTPVTTRRTVNSKEITNDEDMDVDSEEDGKDENKTSDCKSEISDVSDISSDYGSIENEDEEKASSSIIELSGDSSDAASSFLPTLPRRRGRHASSRFSPRVDENTRPHRLRHTTSVTGSEGLGVGDSDLLPPSSSTM